MKWWCSFLHGLDWLRLIEIENTYLLPGHDNSRHPVRAAGIPLLHFRHDSAKPQAADLHAPFALVDFRRNAMGMKIFLRIWFQNQRFPFSPIIKQMLAGDPINRRASTNIWIRFALR